MDASVDVEPLVVPLPPRIAVPLEAVDAEPLTSERLQFCMYEARLKPDKLEVARAPSMLTFRGS